ncbi:tRNA (pseudouridine(54)-N(1))-methyltransferase TrmY [Halobacteriales archaeon Cl-PHB]
MRQFVVLGHDAPTTADVSLEDLPGHGRLDLLARSVTSALLLSHGIRGDTRIHLVLGNTYTISVDGSTVRNLNPDERSTAARIRSALEEREEAIGHVPVETSPGVELTRMGTEATLERVAGDGTVLQLHEDGDPATDVDPPADPVFVLSDHRNFTEEEQVLLEDLADDRVSLGPRHLHGDQAITVAHHWLDTRGYQRW